MKHSGNENLNQGLETFVFLRGFYKVSWSWWHGVFLLTYSKIVKCNCPGRRVYLFNNGNGVCIVPLSKNTFDLWTACLCQQCPDVVENDSIDLKFFCYKKNMRVWTRERLYSQVLICSRLFTQRLWFCLKVTQRSATNTTLFWNLSCM